MPIERVKRNWEIDRDVLEAFDQWTDNTGMMKGVAAQLGMWVIMELDPAMRQACLDRMNSRHPSTASEVLGVASKLPDAESFGHSLRKALAKGDRKHRGKAGEPRGGNK